MTFTGRISYQRDSVVYVGLNDSSTEAELNAIRKGKPGITPVTSDGDKNVRSKRDDSYFVTVPGKKGHPVDLATRKGREEFLKSQDLPAGTVKKLEKLLADAPTGFRDELAGLIVAWAPAERGGQGATRLVLSGHSGGDGLYGETGEDKEKLTVELLGELARAMPKAAGQVEDLAISACSCGGRDQVEQWRSAFPNLKTMLAYVTSSPDVTQGSSVELEKWEKLTRGDARELAPAGFNPNAATWSVKNGYLTPNSIDVAKVRKTIAELQPLWDRVKTGELPMDADTKTKMNRYRTALRQLSGADNAEVSGEERAKSFTQARSVLFAVHYDEWKGKFQKKYGAMLGKAYDQLGLERPAKGFDKMTRAEAVTEVDRVIKAMNKAGYPGELADQTEVLRALRRFDTEARIGKHGRDEVLPTPWIN